ncbi:hypothetical protein NMY22_g5403 [Coprinellus aureogranulatus]|nr:hypothetical protein NMY22_g5403 [Coprinellus aureogranulatus]
MTALGGAMVYHVTASKTRLSDHEVTSKNGWNETSEIRFGRSSPNRDSEDGKGPLVSATGSAADRGERQAVMPLVPDASSPIDAYSRHPNQRVAYAEGITVGNIESAKHPSARSAQARSKPGQHHRICMLFPHDQHL